MYPSGLKKVVELLVEAWKESVTQNAALDTSKQATDSELFARLPTWGVRSLRELLGLVIASYDYTIFYEEMLLSAHESSGTTDHPFWFSETWEIDYEKLITGGLGTLRDIDILMLALHPAAVVMTHECVREELMYGDRIADEWRQLVSRAYKERKREVVGAAGDLDKNWTRDTPTSFVDKTDSAQLDISSLRRKRSLLRIISGESVDKFDIEVASISEYCESGRETCSRCGETWWPGQERCWLCKDCPEDNVLFEDVTDDSADMMVLQDQRASLSDLSLEKLEARKVLKRIEMPAVS